MGDFGLDDWADLADEGWPNLLVGNGASCAVSTKFAYGSLFDAAPLEPGDVELFQTLDTLNFEEVLNHLRTARLICGQLGHDDDEVQDRYLSIRDALIDAVHDHHVAWDEVDAGDRLVLIREALLTHEKVFSTSYDLLVYWAVMNVDEGKGFGDLFWNAQHRFDPDDTEPHGPKTLVYWLHGALHLQREADGTTVKRTNAGANLLETFAAGGPPLFVTEGTADQKRSAIRRSDYLSHCFRTFSASEGPLAVFGQALGPQDQHLVSAIRKHPDRNIAYAVYAGTPQQANLIQASIEDLLHPVPVVFFDARTHPLGDPTLMVP